MRAKNTFKMRNLSIHITTFSALERNLIFVIFWSKNLLKMDDFWPILAYFTTKNPKMHDFDPKWSPEIFPAAGKIPGAHGGRRDVENVP